MWLFVLDGFGVWSIFGSGLKAMCVSVTARDVSTHSQVLPVCQAVIRQAMTGHGGLFSHWEAHGTAHLRDLVLPVAFAGVWMVTPFEN